MENPQIPQETEKQQNKTFNKWSMLALSWELGYIIAIPILLFGLLGKWLDARTHHSFPYLTLVGIALAIVSSTLWLVQRLKKYIKS